MGDSKKTGIALLITCLLILACGKPYLDEKKQSGIEALKVIMEQYNSDNWQERYDSLEKLSKYISTSDPKILEPFLLKATEDSHSSVRIIAVQNLIKFPSAAVMKRISEIASDNSASNDRLYALKTLGEFRKVTAIPVFLKGLECEDWLIRETSILGILMIEDFNTKYRLIPYIIKALNDSSDVVKIATLSNLNIKDDILYEEIVKIFNINFEAGLKNSLLRASLKALAGYKLDDKTRKKVIILLTDVNKDIRLLSLKVLKEEKVQIKFD